MNWSGLRVGRIHAHVTKTSPVLAYHGLARVCYDNFVGVKSRESTWQLSNNSAHPIQREILVSRSLRPSDRQAQPSIGTQRNNGSDSPLANGSKLRAVQSHLALALKGFVRCNSRPFRRGNRQVSPKLEGTRRSEARGSVSVIRIGCAKSGRQVSYAFSHALTICVSDGKGK